MTGTIKITKNIRTVNEDSDLIEITFKIIQK